MWNRGHRHAELWAASVLRRCRPCSKWGLRHELHTCDACAEAGLSLSMLRRTRLVATTSSRSWWTVHSTSPAVHPPGHRRARKDVGGRPAGRGRQGRRV